jgi:hypothetical protein
MKYELWHSREGSSDIYTLHAADKPRESVKGVALESDAKLIRIFDANTWEDACRQQHEFLGWEPYKPMQESS